MESENSGDDSRDSSRCDSGKYAILFIEDEDISRVYFKRRFAKEFRIITATNVTEGLDVLQQRHREIAIIVTDQRMPGGTGADLLVMAKALYPDIVRMLTTAYIDIGEAARAVNEGSIYRFIEKPWDLDYLNQSLIEGMALFNRRRLLGELALSRGLRLADLSATFSRKIISPLDSIRSVSNEATEVSKTQRKADPQEQQSAIDILEAAMREVKDECEKMSDGVADMHTVLNQDVNIAQMSSPYLVRDCIDPAIASLAYDAVDWSVNIAGDTSIGGFGSESLMITDLRDLLYLLLDNVRDRGLRAVEIEIFLTAGKYASEVLLGFRAESSAEKNSDANAVGQMETNDGWSITYNASRRFVRCQSNICGFGGSLEAVPDQDGNLRFRILLPAGDRSPGQD